MSGGKSRSQSSQFGLSSSIGNDLQAHSGLPATSSTKDRRDVGASICIYIFLLDCSKGMWRSALAGSAEGSGTWKTRMRMITDASMFRSDRAWGAIDIAEIEGASVRLHWTDKPYVWHRNEGVEAFVVIAGEVDMRWRVDGDEGVERLKPGDIFVAHDGDEHVAHPIGEARVLVVERRGSV